MEIDEVTRAWELAAHSKEAQGYIHPAGHISDDEYEMSGRVSADLLWEAVDLYLIKTADRFSVLDFGCGDGRVLKYVQPDIGEHCYGADASQGMLDRLKQRVPMAHAICSNGVDEVLDGMGFNLIYSWAVFIHHDHRGGRDMMAGLAKAAAPGGILALQIPCYDVARERDGWIDVTVWTKELIEAAAQRAGLQVVELATSPGAFSYENAGENHLRLQVFRKN